jgi:hypothetical protein
MYVSSESQRTLSGGFANSKISRGEEPEKFTDPVRAHLFRDAD